MEPLVPRNPATLNRAKYSLTPLAVNGLNALEAPFDYLRARLDPNALGSTSKHPRSVQYTWDGAQGAVIVNNPTDRHLRRFLPYLRRIPIQGLSSKLNIYSTLYSLDEWVDSRSQSLLAEHELQLHPTSTLIHQLTQSHASAHAVLSLYSKPTYRASWFYYDDNGHEPTRHRHELNLSEHTRDYFSSLAQYHHMKPPHHSAGETALISAALEAIGLHLLKPPQP